MIVLNVRSLNDHTVSLWTTVQKNKKITEKIDNKSSAHFLIYIYSIQTWNQQLNFYFITTVLSVLHSIDQHILRGGLVHATSTIFTFSSVLHLIGWHILWVEFWYVTPTISTILNTVLDQHLPVFILLEGESNWIKYKSISIQKKIIWCKTPGQASFNFL